MTEGQQQLLQLLKELDRVCKQNNIVYYLAGGTLIGAIRHRGFVPWDDDMDLYMTRDEFNKLVKVAKQGGLPKGRILECQELNRSYGNVFARYTDVTSTAIHTAQIATNDVAGEVVDILQLDPVPDDKKAQDKHFKNLMLYSEFINLIFPYSHRSEQNRFRYRLYNKLRKVIGKNILLKHLEKKMFSYPESECNYYMMRWGGTPLLFPKEMFTEPITVDFEDMKAYIPKHYNEYLIYHYGDEWFYTPSVDSQMSHNAVHSKSYTYEDVRKLYRSLISKRKLFREYNQRKHSMIQNSIPIHRTTDVLVNARAILLKEEILRKIQSGNIDLEKLYKTKKYSQLKGIFVNYYNLQKSPQFSGRDTFDGLYRYQNPVLIDLPVDILKIALKVWFDLGNASNCWRTLEIYEYKKGELPEELLEIKNAIQLQRDATTCYSMGKTTEAISLLKQLLKLYPNNIAALKFQIQYMLQAAEEEKNISALIKQADTLAPDDGEILKFKADLIYHASPKEAVQMYLEALEKTSNGMMHLDINDRLKEYTEELIQQMSICFENGSVDEAQMIKEEISCILPSAKADTCYISGILDNEPSYEALIKLWKKWKEIILSQNSPKEIFELGESILLALNESPYVAYCHIMLIKSRVEGKELNTIKNILEERINCCKKNEMNNICMELEKLYADIMKSEGNISGAYIIYRRIYDHLPVFSIVRQELTEMFLDDVNIILETSQRAVSETDLRINAKAKFGDWLGEREKCSTVTQIKKLENLFLEKTQ